MPRLTPACLPLLLAAVLGPGLAPAGASAASDAVWTRTAPGFQRGPQNVAPDPAQSATFALRRGALAPRLEAAPRERTRAARRTRATVSLPLPDGSLQRFRVVESPVMEPELAAKVPQFKSYAAIGLDDPTATARLDLSSLGLHATVRSAAQSWFVDPVGGLDPERHVAYRGTEDSSVGLREPIESPAARRGGAAAGRPAPGALVPRREYRLALASDPTYAAEFGTTNVDEAKAILVDRANQLYNDDLAIKLVLVANNDSLNYDTTAAFATAGYPATAVTPTCDLTTLVENQNAIDAEIGASDYDVGHLVLASNGGGVAGLGVVGRDGQKARGCTGTPNPRGDGFAIDYFAHELGHEFGGNHTFDGSQGSCGGGNRNGGTSVEPGSGSSVMAYAGICDADDLQNNTDPYFSERSLTEIQAYVASSQATGSRNGGRIEPTANHAPVVTAPPARTIPARTPFTLAGSATDQDGDALIYLWEQNDTGAGNALTSDDKADGALFRQFGTAAVEVPTTSPAPGQNLATAANSSRTFPDLAQIASGNTNAASGGCPTGGTTTTRVECFSEFLPTVARTMNFRLTARDRVLGGGGESSADTQITVAGSAPFRVSSQAAPASTVGGATVPVTWDVAGTNAAPVSAANVRIRYSTDGGLTFPTVLAESTANDGATLVAVPNTQTTQGRFRVEAIGNVFFDLSDADLTVGSPPPAPAPASAPPPAATPGPPRQPPVVTPPALTGDAAKNPAKIRVLRAGVKAKRLDVLAEITRRASGTVRVAYRSGGKTTRFTAKIDGGRIRFKRKLSGASARKTTGIFTLTYAGDDDVRADRVRLRAANGRAGLRRGTTRINAGILEVSGRISKRARGVVRIRLEYLNGNELVLDTFRAKISKGRWSLKERLPGAAAVAGGQLSIQFTGYERARMRGEQSAKRVAPG